MSILTSGLRAGAPAATAAPVDDQPSLMRGLSRGFARGAPSSGADLATLAATSLDALDGAQATRARVSGVAHDPLVNAGGMAKSLYDTGAGLRQKAANSLPFTDSFRDINSVGTGLEYLGGLVGQSAPALGAGIAGALVSRNPMVGATLATAPFAAGSLTSRQQEDATIAALPAGQRLASAVGTGVRQAAVENIVPVAMGGKLLGRGVGQMGLGRNVAQNVGEGVVGNAAAGAIGENMAQRSLTGLNGARDTSGDMEGILEAAVGGAAVGAPLAGAGIAGQWANGKGAAPRVDGVPLDGAAPAPLASPAPAPLVEAGARVDAPTLNTTRLDAGRKAVGDEFVKPEPTLMDRIKGAFKSSDDDVEMSMAERIAQNQETVDADVLRNAPPDQHGTILERADNERVEKVKAWASKMYEDASLAPESRAAIDDFMSAPMDRTKQATVAGLHQARTVGETAVNGAKDFFDSMSEKYKNRNDGRALSELDNPKLNAAIADTVAPALGEKFPALVQNENAMKSVTGSLRRVMDMMQKDGAIDDDVSSQLRGWFGKDAPSIMAALHNSVGDAADKIGTERYYQALSGLSDSLNNTESLTALMRKNLPGSLRETATDKQLQEMSRGIREFVEGKGSEKKPKAQVEFERTQIEAGLRETFGDGTDALLDKFREDSEKRRKMTPVEESVLDDGKAIPDEPLNSDDGFAEGAEYGVTTEQDTRRQYYGGGNDKANPAFILSEQAHRRLYNNDSSQAARLKQKVMSENEDMNVTEISAKDYARENGIPVDEVMKGLKGDPADYVMIRAEGMKREGITWKDVDSARLDTQKYSDSPSRIDTEEGTILDARRVLNMYAQENKLARTDADAANPFYRLRRQFTEAIAALSDHLGENIEVDGHVVVARRGGKDITWKELQEKGRAPTTARDDGMSKLYNEREAIVKANGKDAAAEVDAAIKRATEFDDPVATDASATRAELAKQLGAASKLVDTAREQAGPRGATVRDLRRQALAMEDMIERMKTDHYREAKTSGQSDMFRPTERKMWETNAAKLRALADALDEAGGARPLTPKERGAIAEYNKQVKAYERFEAQQAERNRRAAKGNLDDPRGPAEADPLGNVHEAMDGIGDAVGDAQSGRASKAFAGARNMEAGPEGNMLHADNFSRPNPDGSLPPTIRSAIAGKIDRLANQLTDQKTRNLIAWNIAQKAKLLFDNLDRMKVMDQGMLASIVKDAKMSSIGQTVNDLHAKYAERFAKEAAPAKKPSAFVERVLGEGDLSSTKAAIKKSANPVELQRVVDALGEHYKNPRAREVLDAANERLASMIEADPDIAYSMQRTNPNVTNTSGKLADVRDHIEKVLGRSVDVEFRKMLHAGEFLKAGAKANVTKDTIRVSVFSMDPMGTAYHESLHAFLTKLRRGGLMDDAHPIMKAADSLSVKNKLRELLANEPDALKQVERSLEERAAYMYQFWASGQLTLPAKPAGVLGVMADFFRSVLGIWTNDQRATHIMEYFNSGEYAKDMQSPGNRALVSKALQEGTNASVEQLGTMLAPLGKLANAVAATGDGRLRGSMIPALMELADKVYAPLQGAGDDPGYMPAARTKRTEVLNALAEKIGQYPPAAITDALKSLQQGVKGASPEERIVMREVKKMLGEMKTYMTDAGVQMGDLGPDYFPRVWEPSTIIDNEPAFRAMLESYRTKGQFTGSVDQIISVLTRADGSDLQVETVKPGMQYSKERVLGFISALDAEPFLRKNLYDTLNSYVTQATRRAEWSRRFGDDGAGLHALLDRAKEEGADAADLQLASDYLQGVDGTLGDSINPKLRRAFGNMIVYQNVRLLPLAIFSSVIDPMGVMVRGGTVGEAFNTAKRGFKEIAKNFKKTDDDEATKLAATLGVIDSTVLMKTIGSSFSQGMTSDLGRRVNDVFFKYNLMEQFNVSMRVGASEAALGFLGRHADGKASAHSARWLAELGLKPGDVVMAGDRPALSVAEFVAAGQTPAKAQLSADKMTLAVNKWVDGAVLRPNAAHKPVWMNDPHFALISHLKQFVYAFQETILKRVANEARHGNVGPAYALAAYIPFMIAADMAKGVIVGNNQRDEWDLGDWLWHGGQRAGLFGVGQFGIDAVEDVQRGGFGIGALSGPTVEQLGDAVSVAAGPQQFQTFALNALPANALIDAAGAATASDVVR